MDWLLIAGVILLIEIIIIMFFWDKISESFSSYTTLYEKAAKLAEAGEKKRAVQLYEKMLAHKEMELLPEDNPLKMAAYTQASSLYEQIFDEDTEGVLPLTGEREIKQALRFKEKELKAKGLWEINEDDPEYIRLILKSTIVYINNGKNLQGAVDTFFHYSKWDYFLKAYNRFMKSSEYDHLNSEERASYDKKAILAQAILDYDQGAREILEGNASGKERVDGALEIIRELLNEEKDFLQINDPVFNEIKEKLENRVVEEIAAAEEADLKEEKDTKQNRAKQIKGVSTSLAGDNWKKIVSQILKVSRVITDVKQDGTEVTIFVQTEWYLLPLIFKEELVEKVAKAYYSLTLKKEGSILFVFKDDKKREVARHTVLGIKIYK